jgi:hypothetical protein
MAAASQDLRQFAVGETVFSTKVANRWGELDLLAGFDDGGFYLIRTDVPSTPGIQVDETFHFIGPDHVPYGVARLPLDEFYYTDYHTSSITVSDTGQIFVLLPRQASISIIRLNFYQHLEPFMPGAALPQITSSDARP